ncbi:MAG TPA: AraC family transcriptional regulator [Thermoanaerobaculia bacterium]|nr:AraC family transcriptional regulator [Thermoanaerobaculia bacterium]
MIAQQTSGETLWTGDCYDRIERTLSEFRQHSASSSIAVSYPRDIARMIDYVHDHLFDSSLNVNGLKAGCRLRNNNVTTRFRQRVGMGLREYIEKLRLEAAARLLMQREIAVYLVAMAVGYEHYETFFRAFQRYFGCTPSDVRLRGGWVGS